MQSTILSTEVTLPGDAPQAEELLFDLATELVRLPFGGATRNLHIRALELKRRLEQWARVAPSEAERQAARDGILELQREAARWRECSRR